MIDTVKYQLDRAEDALRTALTLGATKEDPYLLKQIAETITTIDRFKTNWRYNQVEDTKEDDTISFTTSLDGPDKVMDYYDPDYNVNPMFSAYSPDTISFGNTTSSADIITFS